MLSVYHLVTSVTCFLFCFSGLLQYDEFMFSSVSQIEMENGQETIQVERH